MSNYKFSVFHQFNEVASEWIRHSKEDDILFGEAFLKVVERYIPDGIRPIYVRVDKNDGKVIFLYFQLKYVRLSENLRIQDADKVSRVQKAILPLRNAIVKSIQYQTLICGNLLVTGPYGVDFTQVETPEEMFLIVSKAMDVVKNNLEKEGIVVELMLIKDVFEPQIPEKKKNQYGYTKFKVQPKMVFLLRSHWNIMGDYLSELRSKYRVRANKAFELGRALERKILTYEDLVAHRNVIFNLYKNISDQAGFNAFLLQPDYFENLKLALGNSIEFNAYWLDGKIVAFYSVIINHDTLNAHFLGYNPDDNLRYKLYLNMLLDIIGEGIERKMKKIDFSRTAIEIKSTVGAAPEDLYLFVKHANPIMNKSLDALISIINPEYKYMMRHPFKT